MDGAASSRPPTEALQAQNSCCFRLRERSPSKFVGVSHHVRLVGISGRILDVKNFRADRFGKPLNKHSVENRTTATCKEGDVQEFKIGYSCWPSHCPAKARDVLSIGISKVTQDDLLGATAFSV